MHPFLVVQYHSSKLHLLTPPYGQTKKKKKTPHATHQKGEVSMHRCIVPASTPKTPGSPAMQLLLMWVNKLSMASSKTFLGRLARKKFPNSVKGSIKNIFNSIIKTFIPNPPRFSTSSKHLHQLVHSPNSFDQNVKFDIPDSQPSMTCCKRGACGLSWFHNVPI